MKKLITILIFVVSSLGISTQTNALVIQDLSLFFNSPDLGAVSLVDSPLYGTSDFGSGLDLTFTDALDAEGYGTFSWSLVNNSGATFSNSSLFAFFDAEIDQATNTFFNENGALVSVSGTGAADNLPDFWEIDEPEYVFGDIYTNLLNGSLDNSNNVPAGLEDDVSLALGFILGSFNPGDILEAVFTVSADNIGGLSHTDPDSGITYFFNGVVNLIPFNDDPVSVPEPSTLVLFLSFISCMFLRRRNK